MSDGYSDKEVMESLYRQIAHKDERLLAANREIAELMLRVKNAELLLRAAYADLAELNNTRYVDAAVKMRGGTK